MVAIPEAPISISAKELRCFTRVCSLLSQFMSAYAIKKGGMPHYCIFSLISSHTKEFLPLQRQMAGAKPLKSFAPSLKTVFTTDASENGAGAVLSQITGSGDEKSCLVLEPNVFASRNQMLGDGDRSPDSRECCREVESVLVKPEIHLEGRPRNTTFHYICSVRKKNRGKDRQVAGSIDSLLL